MFFFFVLTTTTFGLLLSLKTWGDETSLSYLASANLEALTMDENNGLPDDWEQGRKMAQEWVPLTASMNLTIGEEEIKVEGGVKLVRLSCCVKATQADACNRPKEHPECVNVLP